MEPQFILNLGCLDKYNLKPKDFFDMLGIDVKKAISGGKDCTCPKCYRGQEDVYLVYHKYKDFKFGVDHEGQDADYCYTTINLYLCICGCLYYLVSKPSRITCKTEIIEEDEKKER